MLDCLLQRPYGADGPGKKLGRRAFLAGSFGLPPNLERDTEEVLAWNRAVLVDRLHWTPDYIDAMDPLERVELAELLQALDAVRNWRLSKGG